MIKIKNNTINFVMYHFVKNKKNNKFLNLNVLDLKKFEEQIINFKNRYNILDNDELCEILKKKKIPKKPSFVLTFDDGYKDHYNYVFPILMKHKLKAIFYPSTKIFQKNYLLDVNKIQLILGQNKNKKELLERLYNYIEKYTGKDKKDLNLQEINLGSRYDSKDTILIKRLLQFYLDKKIRTKIINLIFEDTFKDKSSKISEDFYLNKEDALEMFKNGMSFGTHGFNHYWFSYLTKKQQENEVVLSINYLKKNKIFTPNLSLCYPYGSYDSNTIIIAKKLRIKFAVTTDPNSLHKINSNNIYKIPRFDCNDFI